MTAAHAATPRATTRGADNRMRRRTMSRFGLTALAILTAFAPLHGQMPSATVASNASPNASGASTTAATEVRLLVGRSTIINHPSTITRVSLTTPDVADAMVTAPQQVLVHGKAPGTISLMVWDRSGSITTFEVIVERDLSPLVQQVKQLFPGEPISVAGSGKDIVLAGTVTSKYVVEKAAEVAAGYVDKKENVVNLLRQEEGLASNQVMLRVRFAEVNRNAMQELGINLFSDLYKNKLWSTTTQQFPAPFFDQNKAIVKDHLVFSDYLNLFFFDMGEGLGATIKALQNRGLFQSLAEPNLVAQNGKEASFLAGGEYPYPVVQGSATNVAVTITFKEFGIRLNFIPTILQGDVVHLKVRPEVSSLDFGNAITVQGFRVPSLMTRRADTEVELRDGQTFAIAGLMNNTLSESMQKIPGIGDIPVLGLLFKSRALQKQQTELVVMITPHILRRNSTGVSPRLPNIEKEYMEPIEKPLPPPAPYMPQADGTLRQMDQIDQPQTAPVNAATGTDAGPTAAVPGSNAGSTAAEQASATVVSEKDRKKAVKQRAEAERKAAKAAEEQQRRDAKAAAEADKALREQQLRDAEAAREARTRAEKAAEEQRKKDAKRLAEKAREDEKAAKAAEKSAKVRAKIEAEVEKLKAEIVKKQAKASGGN